MNGELAIVSADELLWKHYQALANEWTLRRVADCATLLSGRLPRSSLLALDADLPGLPAWSDERLQEILAFHTTIALTGTPSARFGVAVLDAGAHGYCHAYASPETLRQALRTIQAGQLWVGREVMNLLLQRLETDLPFPPSDQWHSGLTDRELQVAKRAAFGETNQEIATALNITERTVKAHLSSTFEKLGVADRLQLALRVHGIK
ncbi:MAG: response regulator transcription factor [Gammaproteobacteria bacterium]